MSDGQVAAMTVPRMASPTSPQGHLFFHALPSLPAFGAFIYVPNAGIRDARAMVLVHGITRNAAEHALRFVPFAEQHQTCLIAPLFARAIFPRYQTLMRRDRSCAAPEDAMDALLADIQQRFSLDLSTLHGFGFSGGAQFMHRYAMRKPAHFRRVVVAAAGWYTFPDASAPYPRGIGGNAPPCIGKQLPAFLRLPMRVIVGSRDNQSDAALNQNPEILRQQGRTRVGRGKAFVHALHAKADALGLTCGAEFVRLRGAGHDFSDAMARHGLGEETIAFLFPDGDEA